MSNQADGILTTEPFQNSEQSTESKQAKENTAALKAAENEGLPVVGLGDERPDTPASGKVIENAPATNVPAADTSEVKRKQA